MTNTTTQPDYSTRPVQILDNLTRQGPLSTSQLVDALGESTGPMIRFGLLNRYGDILRRHEETGHVARAGKTAPRGQHGPSIIWEITAEGRDWLACRHACLHHIQAEHDRRVHDAAHAMFLTYLLGTVRDRTGPGTPPERRRRLARNLRSLGCTLQQIADVFGVSRESIRLDCLPDDLREARRIHQNTIRRVAA